MMAGRAGEKLAEKVVPQVMQRGGLPAEMLGAMGNRTVSPLDVYHGTPHTLPPTPRNLLGEFDASKIGTGEGAQAYGHGLYFAENKNIAQNYADVLASPRNRVMDKTGVYIEPSPMGDGTYRLARQSEMGKMRGTIGDATQGLTDYQYPNLASAIKGAKKQGYLPKDSKVQLNAIGEDGKYVPVRSASDVTEEKFGFGPEYAQFIASEPGNLYKIDLPDEKIAKMLDYDKHLSEQAPEVQNILLPYQKEIGSSFGTGEQTLKAIAFERRMKGLDDSPAAVAQQLKDMGIPGVKYLDASSRGTGGTRNFVVFPGEEKSMTILERNGQKFDNSALMK
jgi:hypothetical protein